MSRFTQLFNQEFIKNRPAYIPFLMLGDPDAQTILKIINAVILGGIDALELGIPFSDPIADGPTVQQASLRARQSGVNVEQCFDMLNTIRTKYPLLPIGLLVYANIVFHYGIFQFYQKMQQLGIDAVLIPDVPSQECTDFVRAAKENQIQPILLATPACRKEDLITLSAQSQGYTYVVTRAGVTGTERKSELDSAKSLVELLTMVNAPPAVFGFGIRDHQDVMRSFHAGAKGVIIGSALIDAISKFNMDEVHEGSCITQLVKTLFCGNPSQS
jgi:tryptophan synthase alpha chain